MTRARVISDLVDANGDIKASALDNVPASDDASALTTGTLDAARLPASGVSAASITTGTLPDGRFPSVLPAVSGENLTGVAAFSSGTLMLFQQTTAPTGWTKQTTHNDKALRVVTGTVGSGGSSPFTTALGTPSVGGTLSGSIGSTTLSINQIPSHSHTVQYRNGSGGNVIAAGSQNQAVKNTTTLNRGGSGSHNHNFSGNLSGSTASINVQYVDIIIASKD